MPYDFHNSEVTQLMDALRSQGYTQERVNRVYELLGLGPAPVVPAGLIGNHQMAGRAGMAIVDSSGRRVGTRTGEIADFLNTFGQQAVDPYREYGLGNYLGVAGMLVGAAGAAGAFSGAAAAPGTSAGGLVQAAPTSAGAAGTSASPGLGIFSNGGAAGMAGVGGGNAGALAASGAIGGGAGIAGTAAGALGGLSGLANSVSGVGGRMGWTDWIGPAVTVAGSLIGSRQANDATSAAQRVATDEQRRQFDLVRGDTAAMRALGDKSIGTLNQLSGYNESGKPDLSAFYASPEYQFNLSEGQQAVDRSAAARGGLLSGAAVKEGTRYASGLASRERSAFIDRLLQQAGLGSTGIGASAAAGANSANNIGAYAVNAGNARASTYMNNAANVSNAVNTGFSNNLLRRYLGTGISESGAMGG